MLTEVERNDRHVSKLPAGQIVVVRGGYKITPSLVTDDTLQYTYKNNTQNDKVKNSGDHKGYDGKLDWAMGPERWSPYDVNAHFDFCTVRPLAAEALTKI